MVRIVFMGTSQFAVPVLQRLVQGGYQVVVVYTQPDKQAGRGCLLTASPVKQLAEELGLSVRQPESLKTTAALTELAGFGADAIVLAAYGQILPPTVLQLPEFGCLNIHPSLLPRHRGASPVAAAILAGDRFTGISIMLMDEGLDTGPVISRAQLAVMDNDTSGSLGFKLSLVAANLLPDVLPDWIKGQLEAWPQPEDGATCSGTIKKQHGCIDWYQTALEIWRRVRAFQPWPGCYTRWCSKTLKIMEAAPLAGVADAVGCVVSLPEGGLAITTGDGLLQLLVLQLEGKRAMTADEFLRGQRHFIGALLTD
jgi:methionyl-tRNA formyltransferase